MEKRIVEINGNLLVAFYDEAPSDDCVYSIETTSNSGNKYGQHFFPRKLSGLSGDDFPSSTSLAIYDLKSGFKFLDMLYVRRCGEDTSLELLGSIDFHSWDLPESLGTFIDRYVAKLRESELVHSVSATREDYGYFIKCAAPVGSEDLFSKFSELEGIMESTYRNYLLPAESNPPQAYGDGRLHWWIRYVIVPLVGSGAVAAVFARYLAGNA